MLNNFIAIPVYQNVLHYLAEKNFPMVLGE